MAYRIPLSIVRSSNLLAVGYDPARSILAIQFHSGEIYHYAGISPAFHAALVSAPSLGRFYGDEIRGKFAAEKMTGACGKCGDTGYIGERCEDCGCDEYRGPILHSLCWDHPAAQDKRRKPTDCGASVRPSEIARDADSVTCADCRQIIAERDAMAIE